MRALLYRSVSIIYRYLRLSPDRKEAIKALVYRNLGPLFRGSPNYGDWLRANPTQRAPVLAAAPVLPTAEAWESLLQGKRTEPTDVDSSSVSMPGRPYIVVPVYLGRSETLACLYSVCVSAPDARLVVIDDASPDARLAADLRRLASAGHFQLVRNPTNQGFLRTANLGLAFDSEADVVLLNSDTEVFRDWLARLNAAAYREPDVGTVTPLSNNGDIASYPRPGLDNRAQLESDFSEIDALASEANAGLSIETPTGVGYCLYIRRECIAEIGVLDERFAEGYGEENDFCLRAGKSGWRSVISGDVYVRHTGAVSFRARAVRLRRAALDLLTSRYPDYSREVKEFWRRDSLRRACMRLDAARLRRSHPVQAPVKSILFVMHDWGGGIEEHIRELTRRLTTEQIAVYVLRARRRGDSLFMRLESSPIAPAPALEHAPTIDEITLEARDDLVDALRFLEIDHVHLHHLGEFSESGAGWLTKLCGELDVAYDVTLHDYASICPRLHLEDPSGRYCGEPAVEGCRRCLNANGSRFGAPEILDWRRDGRMLLAGARRVFCPTEDQRRRMAARWPEPAYVVRGHPERATTPVALETRAPANAAEPRATEATETEERIRVLVPGAINDQKGLALLIRCASDARTRSLPLEFWIVGYSADDVRAERAGIVLAGRHALGTSDREIARVLQAPSLAFLPSLSPETWSYALSSVLRIGVHPVVFDLGALAERVRGVGRGTILPFELADHPAAVNDALLALRGQAARPIEPLSELPNSRYEILFRDYYGSGSGPGYDSGSGSGSGSEELQECSNAEEIEVAR